MEQFQVQFHQQARNEQQEFCRQWVARVAMATTAEGSAAASSSEPSRTTNNETITTTAQLLPPLIPSALHEIKSLFNDDVTYWMEVYPGNDIVSNHINRQEGWESDQVSLIGQWLRDYQKQQNLASLAEVTFVDIGANVGWYTFAMAAMGVSVIAIEPFENNVELMRRSLCRNSHLADRVTIYPIALSSTSTMSLSSSSSSSSNSAPGQHKTSCRLRSASYNFGDTTLVCGKSEDVPLPESGVEVRGKELTLYRVDDVMGTIVPVHQHIGALKMDTEGHEGHVVAGGPIFFGSGRIPHIQSEYNPQWIGEKGSDPKTMLQTFENAGYKVRRVGSNSYATWPEAYAWQDMSDIIFEKAATTKEQPITKEPKTKG